MRRIERWLKAAPQALAACSVVGAKDMPYTPYTDATLRRIAELGPQTLAVMHGSTFQGDGAAAIQSLAQVIRETLGEQK